MQVVNPFVRPSVRVFEVGVLWEPRISYINASKRGTSCSVYAYNSRQLSALTGVGEESSPPPMTRTLYLSFTAADADAEDTELANLRAMPT